MQVLGKLTNLVLDREFTGRKFALRSVVFLNTLVLLPNTVFANTDSLGGVPEGSSTTSETSGSLSREQANEMIQRVRESVPKPSKEKALESVNKAVDTARESTWDSAVDFTAPIGSVLMFAANSLWVLAMFGFFFQTAVDVVSIVWSGPREYFMSRTQNNQEQGFSFLGLLGSFFTLSYDARQVIESAGLSTGSQQQGGGYNRGGLGMNQGGGMGQFGGSPMGSPMGGSYGQGNQRGQGNRPVSAGNLLGRYISLHMRTLVWLGIALAIFATSFATEFQGQAVSLVMALLKGVGNLIMQGWNGFFG